MKYKIRHSLLFFVLLSVILMGCGGKMADVTTISIAKDGTVTHTIIEPFGGEYNVEELSKALSDEVSKFQSESGRNDIEIISVESVDEDTAKAVMKYPDMDTFKSFYDMDAVEPSLCFYGSTEEAEKQGFQIDLELLKHKKTGKPLSEEEKESVFKKNSKVFIYDNGMNMNYRTRVVFPENITYYSDYVEITGSKSADFTGEVGDIGVVLLK